MKKCVFLIGLAILAASCSSDDSTASDDKVVYMLPQTRSISLSADQQQIVSQCNDFAFDLFRGINQTIQEKNGFLVSPLSTAYVMGMLWQGAQGRTAEQIAAVLGLDRGVSTQSAGELFRKMMKELPEVDPSVTLKSANLVAANKMLSLSKSYSRDVENYYNAHVTSLDFNLTSSLNYLNEWCGKHTEGMIPTILDRLDPANMLVLMNATYFKATWTEKFDKADTRNEAFTGDNSQLTLPMMHRKALMLYADNDLFSMINLPYGSGDKWSMKVLLPQVGKSVDDIMTSLTEDTWRQSQQQLSPAVVDVKLPRFTTQTSLKLNDVLSRLGASAMFSPQEADFSLMCSNAPLYVSLLLQKSALELSEEGTQMSAVTIAEIPAGAAGPVTEEREFHATRPFVYVVQEASSGAVLFVGVFRGN